MTGDQPQPVSHPEWGPMGTVQRFVRAALAQYGDPYKLGAKANPADADPPQFDCAELTQWAAGQAGVPIQDGTIGQFLSLRDTGALIPVDQAVQTPGALLFWFTREPVPDDISGVTLPVAHVAISLGNGRTIEAVGEDANHPGKYNKVMTMAATGRMQGQNLVTFGALIPAMSYANLGFSIAVPVPPLPQVAQQHAYDWQWIQPDGDQRWAPFQPPGGGGGTALVAPTLTATSLAPELGGIDLSTLELRYFTETLDGRALAYGFRTGVDGLTTTANSAAAAARQGSDAFFVWLALPRSCFTVNLNPSEPDRIVDARFGHTDAARVLLEADLHLKSSTSAVLHPDTESGAQFWAMFRRDGLTNGISNRLWIVPAPATVFEDGESVYVVDAPLDVMLEVDVSRRPNAVRVPPNRTEEFLRTEVLPNVRHEVNHGQAYAQLRRVYLSRVVAEWYRKRGMGAFLNLIDSADASPWPADPPFDPRTVFDRYVDLFQQGTFNVARFGVVDHELTLVRYFHGGVDFETTVVRQATRSQLLGIEPNLGRHVNGALTRPHGHVADGHLWLGGYGFPFDRAVSRNAVESLADSFARDRASLLGWPIGPEPDLDPESGVGHPSIASARLAGPPTMEHRDDGHDSRRERTP